MKNLFPLILAAMVAISSPAKAEELRIGNQIVLNVEVAHNDVERAQGLMNRTSLAEDAGMLFLFPDARIPAFWMKDTLIPLDMVFIGSDSRIQEIYQNAKPNDLTPISPEKPVRAVLEIGGGMAEKLGLRAGDTVSSDALAKSLELP
ncbi:MAG TPA: DUF192 domain-containing protein [Alphaproteobacteria bacterium]|nr:DUF192 domain-containing protein [Alphaproteobacteria bacterium]HNS44506.1 DUF192 domain-containing protein [Alphaproteobacteria bacterium]